MYKKFAQSKAAVSETGKTRERERERERERDRRGERSSTGWRGAARRRRGSK